MAREDAIFAAVEHIHEAPLAPEGWVRALPSIAATTRCELSIVLGQSGSRATEFAVGFGITSEQLAGFAAIDGRACVGHVPPKLPVPAGVYCGC